MVFGSLFNSIDEARKRLRYRYRNSSIIHHDIRNSTGGSEHGCEGLHIQALPLGAGKQLGIGR